jgi:predicted histone-like DNA-binding protein
MNETIKYSIAMRPNPVKPEEPKKAYACMQHQRTIPLEELADHIVEHGSPFSRGAIYGIIVDLTTCAAEALAEGNNVDLGKLGCLRTTISSQGAKTIDEFSAANIKSLNVNFDTSEYLTGRLAEASFEVTTSRKAQAAALRAEKEGKTVADWTPEVEEDEP